MRQACLTHHRFAEMPAHRLANWIYQNLPPETSSYHLEAEDKHQWFAYPIDDHR